MKRTHPHRRPAHPGFTLLEVIIVVGVIALLAGIIFTVVGGAVASAKEKATRATIAKIDGLLKQQISSFYRNHDPRHPETQALAGNFRPGGTYPLTADRDTSTVLATKAAYQRIYPQNLYETAGFDRTPGTSDDVPLFIEWLTDHNPSDPASATKISEADSSELLFLAMTEGKVLGITPVDRSAFNASELGDTDNDGWTEFVDAWGRPLRFYRWPTRLVNPLGFIASRHDPADGNGLTIGEMSIQLVTGSGTTFSDLPTPFRVVVGREVIEISAVSGDSLTVSQRGAQSTDETDHPPGSKVKLAPFTNLATLLLGFVNSDVLAKDPDDKFGSIIELTPGGTLKNIVPLGDPPFVADAVADYELVFHTLDSYHAPLIVSAGQDGELGLVEPGPVSVTGSPPLPDPSDPRNPQNIWIPGNSLNGSGTPDRWQWGTLAQPLFPPDASAPTGRDLSILLSPGSSTLADNITNYNGSN